MHFRRRALSIVVPALLVVASPVAPARPDAAGAAERPPFQLPFPCGQKWRLDTWGHAPALDMVREPDQHGTEGAKLVAPAAGKVVQSFFHSNAGNMVQVDHGGGWFTTYIHLQSRTVKAGQKVTQGQELGKVGRTGPTSNNHPHLHFELAVDANGDGRASWGTANSERVRPWFDGVEYGQSNSRTWRNVASGNCGTTTTTAPPTTSPPTTTTTTSPTTTTTEPPETTTTTEPPGEEPGPSVPTPPPATPVVTPPDHVG